MPDFELLYGGKTRRPSWAGMCAVSTTSIRIPGGPVDVRAGGVPGGWVTQPHRVRAIIVPVTTGGRETPDVPGRNLSGRPEDRGHVIAFSLGAPNTPDVMIVQGRASNQRIEGGRESGVLPSLSWRATECYLRWAASMALTKDAKHVPSAGDAITVKAGNAGKAPTVTVGGFDTVPVSLAPGDYARAPAPRYTIEYDATVHYQQGYRSDLAKRIHLIITLRESGKGPDVLLHKDFAIAARFAEDGAVWAGAP